MKTSGMNLDTDWLEQSALLRVRQLSLASLQEKELAMEYTQKLKLTDREIYEFLCELVESSIPECQEIEKVYMLTFAGRVCMKLGHA